MQEQGWDFRDDNNEVEDYEDKIHHGLRAFVTIAVSKEKKRAKKKEGATSSSKGKDKAADSSDDESDGDPGEDDSPLAQKSAESARNSSAKTSSRAVPSSATSAKKPVAARQESVQSVDSTEAESVAASSKPANSAQPEDKAPVANGKAANGPVLPDNEQKSGAGEAKSATDGQAMAAPQEINPSKKRPSVEPAVDGAARQYGPYPSKRSRIDEQSDTVSERYVDTVRALSIKSTGVEHGVIQALTSAVLEAGVSVGKDITEQLVSHISSDGEGISSSTLNTLAKTLQTVAGMGNKKPESVKEADPESVKEGEPAPQSEHTTQTNGTHEVIGAHEKQLNGEAEGVKDDDAMSGVQDAENQEAAADKGLAYGSIFNNGDVADNVAIDA